MSNLPQLYGLQARLILIEEHFEKLKSAVAQFAVSAGASPEMQASVAEKADAVTAALKAYHDQCAAACASVGIQPLTGGTNKDDDGN